MGFNTAVMISNDFLGDMAKDPEFGKKLERAILASSLGSFAKPEALCVGPIAQVLQSQHANVSQMVVVGDNQIKRFEDLHEQARVEWLRYMASQLGYTLAKKRKRK